MTWNHLQGVRHGAIVLDSQGLTATAAVLTTQGRNKALDILTSVRPTSASRAALGINMGGTARHQRNPIMALHSESLSPSQQQSSSISQATPLQARKDHARPAQLRVR